jgi:Pilus formation protein N terminal region
MIKSLKCCGLAGVVLSSAFLSSMGGNANAAEVLAVETDRSMMLTLSASPGAIVIGNPSIADVSVNGDKLFLHGRGFGQTNLIVMDLNGNKIMDYDLVVRNSSQSTVAVYTPGTVFGGDGPGRRSYTCLPNCEAQMQVGDDDSYFTRTLTQNSVKLKLGTGSQTAEAAAPAAPQ